MTWFQFTAALIYSLPACIVWVWVILLVGYKRRFSLRSMFLLVTCVALVIAFYIAYTPTLIAQFRHR